uniref:Large ribosomal subunit protein eL14 n=1 Tax=Plectus sambesii TaxID=2011161 RepID=A0A914WRI0_9BILA
MYQRLVQIGRVVYLTKGPDAGKLAVIVDIVDGNRALIDGPCSGVARKVVNFKSLQLTKFDVNIRHSMRTGNVKKAWEEAKISEGWGKSLWAKKIAQRALQSNMNDFDRFKLMKAKQMRSRIIRTEMGKLKKTQKKTTAKK